MTEVLWIEHAESTDTAVCPVCQTKLIGMSKTEILTHIGCDHGSVTRIAIEKTLMVEVDANNDVLSVAHPEVWKSLSREDLQA